LRCHRTKKALAESPLVAGCCAVVVGATAVVTTDVVVVLLDVTVREVVLGAGVEAMVVLATCVELVGCGFVSTRVGWLPSAWCSTVATATTAQTDAAKAAIRWRRRRTRVRRSLALPGGGIV
jgi:hypothetical protein